MKSLTITRPDELDYAAKEALNTLSTNLSFAGNDVKKIMMTSCRPGEGKSFLAMNLMRSLAGIGKQVVLVDADLRKSVLVSRYGIRSSDKMLGLSHYLAGMCPLDDVVFETNIPNAFLVTSGHDVVNSLSLLNTARLSRLLDLLAKSFDYVLIDAPPVGTIIDAAQIALSCDGVVMVIANNTVTRRELFDATKQLEKTGCPVLGAVLNKIAFDTHSSKKYYYKTYYSHYNREYYGTTTESPENKKRKRVRAEKAPKPVKADPRSSK